MQRAWSASAFRYCWKTIPGLRSLRLLRPHATAAKSYAEACEGRWKMAVPMPEKYRNMVMLDATADAEEIAAKVDFIFCAVDMKKDEIRALEESMQSWSARSARTTLPTA